MEAHDGEVVLIAGPNGAGKTTLLRALAGLERIASGCIAIDGDIVDDGSRFVPPHRRSIAMLPQRDYLLPHLSVVDNVAFGLGRPRAEARARARRIVEDVGLADVTGARPDALSGGQARRVALARALAVRPRLLLLDEPLAGIDASSRQLVRRAIESYDGGGIRVVVAHEAVAALSLADHVVVLERGMVVQAGVTDEIRSRPRSRYVADFVGVNLLRGTARGDRVDLGGGIEVVCAEPLDTGSVATLVVHPHGVALYDRPPSGSPRNTWRLRVGSLDEESGRVRVRLDGPPDLVAEVTAESARAMGLAPGHEVYASVKATEIVVQ
jgi:molybdate transport system ATP-binding protein